MNSDLAQLVAQQGWNDKTLLDLTLEYIEAATQTTFFVEWLEKEKLPEPEPEPPILYCKATPPDNWWEMTIEERLKFFEEILIYSDSEHGHAVGEGDYLLIEESTATTGNYWTTRHESPKEAANYHDAQDSGEDWAIRDLVRLSTGEVFADTQTTTFAECPRKEF